MTCFVNARWGIPAFFSGMAALIYQTRWVKQLSLVVGVDVYAVTTGVAASMQPTQQGLSVAHWYPYTTLAIFGLNGWKSLALTCVLCLVYPQ